MDRFNFPVPTGWFYVADPNILKPGELRGMRRFARDLILWRGEDGGYHLQDAYCPHLGANIGVGGCVIENTVQCPFHKWRFDGKGKVAAIPYATKINPYASLETYELREHYGNLMAWYHPNREKPWFDLPAIPELDGSDFRGPLSYTHLIKTCPQEMGENIVDGPHFQTVHNHPGPAVYDDLRFEGPRVAMSSTQVYPSSKGPVEGTLANEIWGYGFGVVRYQTLIEVCMVTVNAPIEKDLTEQVFQVYYKNLGDDPKVDRIAQTFYKEVNRQLMDDQVIWEAKVYRPKPYLCDGDGPIMKFRNWAKQFDIDPIGTTDA